MIDDDLPEHLRGLERPERHPEGVLDLGTDHNRGTRGQREYNWSDDDGRENGSPRVQVVQDAEAFGARQVDADFLARFADRRRQQVGIPGIAPSAGECDLPRPGVTGAHRPVDEQCFQSCVAVVQDHSDGGRDHSTVEGNFGRSEVAQLSTCVLEGGYADTSSPPSTLITLPVIQSAPGWDSATIAPPRSAGVVRRWCGFRCVAISMSFSLPGIFRRAGVSVTPPRNAFTVMPCGASSSASWRVCDSSAAFAADTAPYVANTRVDPDDVMEKMRPPFPIRPSFTTPCAQ